MPSAPCSNLWLNKKTLVRQLRESIRSLRLHAPGFEISVLSDGGVPLDWIRRELRVEAIALHSRASTTSQAIQQEAAREAELQKRYQQLQEQKAELWQLLQQQEGQ